MRGWVWDGMRIEGWLVLLRSRGRKGAASERAGWSSAALLCYHFGAFSK
jgi:hypothetical protein